jgi:hypothetical protein
MLYYKKDKVKNHSAIIVTDIKEAKAYGGRRERIDKFAGT